MARVSRFKVVCVVLLAFFDSGSRWCSAQFLGSRDLTNFFSNLGHGLNSVLTGNRVTFQGSSGPSELGPNYRLVSRDPRDIRYFLYYKRLDPDEYIEVNIGDVRDFNESTFRQNKPLKILIHGFNNNSTGRRFPQDTKNAYLENTDHNIIVVDWGRISTPRVPRRNQADIFYPTVVDNVPMVGEHVGKFVIFLMENGIITKLEDVHLIGFSLGAHVAGFAGAYIERKKKQKVGRITGLDPAGPMFTRVPNDGRLDKTDATFVDVIHSSRLGLYEDIGHVDFYPNGGRYQFNCIKLSDHDNPIETFRNLARTLSGAAGSCGHGRAPEYFTYSIRQGPEKVVACKCESWRDYLGVCKSNCPGKTTFGEYCPATTRGKFYLEIDVKDGDDIFSG